jgi:hypothetical protein
MSSVVSTMPLLGIMASAVPGSSAREQWYTAPANASAKSFEPFGQWSNLSAVSMRVVSC